MNVRIGTKNALLVTCAILLVTIVLSIISIQTLRANIKSQITQQLSIDAIHRMNKIDRFMLERLGDIRILTEDRNGILSTKHYTLDKKIEYLAEIAMEKKVYGSLSLYDLNGIRIADTNNLGIGRNDSHLEFINAAKNKYIYLDPKPIMSESLNSPVLHFSGPIYSENDTVTGILSAQFLISTINDIVKDDQDTFTIDLLDVDGLTIFSNHNNDSMLKKRQDPLYKKISQSKQSVETFIGPVNGQDTLTIVVQQQGFGEYPGEGWILLMGIDTKRAFAPVQKLTKQIIIITLIVIIIILPLSLLLSQKISKPITDLGDAAKDIGKGKFRTVDPIKTGDELQHLGDAFNRSMVTLSKLEDERKQLETLKSQFLSMTAHELRSPMASMIMILKMTISAKFGKLNKKQDKFLNLVYGNCQRLNNVVEDLLEISRIESARLHFNFKKTNLTKATKALIVEMKSFMPKKQVSIISKLDAIPPFEVDPDRVLQVLRNLINNAIKFSKEQSKIMVTMQRKANHVLFSVQDFGIGITPQNQKRLFEPFFQTSKSDYKTFGGTGLGLTICKGIIESQKGRIWLKSKLGEGTTFFFTVPYIPVRNIKPIKLMISHRGSLMQ